MKNYNIPKKGKLMLPTTFTVLDRNLRSFIEDSFKRMMKGQKVQHISLGTDKYFFIYDDQRLYLVLNGVIQIAQKKDQGCLVVFDTDCSLGFSATSSTYFSLQFDTFPLQDKFCYAATKDMFEDTRISLDTVEMKGKAGRKSFTFLRKEERMLSLMQTLRKNNLAVKFNW